MSTTNISDEVKHSAAHILAAAVKRVFPNSKVGIGPVTKTGFYYDFSLDEEIDNQDIAQIEKEVEQIREANLPLTQFNLTKDEAINMLLQSGEIFKAELVQQIPEEEVSFYKLGDEFTDLCRGPHVASTNQIPLIKITDVSKTHWKEDSSRPEMTRLTGKLFRSEEELRKHINIREEIKKRDYKDISVALGLGFKDNEDLLLTNRGSSLLKIIENTVQTNLNDTEDSSTLTINSKEKPSEVFSIVNKYISSKNRSYREFPKHFEINTNLKSRVKSEILSYKTLIHVAYFTDIDAVTSLGSFVERSFDIFKQLGIDVNTEILCSNLDDPNVGLISNILKNKIISHDKVLARSKDYIEVRIKAKDSLDREWVMGLVNIYTANTPKYMTESNHFATTKVVETVFVPMNMFAYILEDSKGILSDVLKPTKIIVVPISKEQNEFANEVKNLLIRKGITAEVDTRSKSMQVKIKAAEKKEIPIIFVIGNKELINKSVSVRQNSMEVGLISLENIDEYLFENLK